MKSKFFTVALAMALVAIACAVAGASPPDRWSGNAAIAGAADNFVESSSEPAGMTTQGVWSMAQIEVTSAPIMAPVTDLSFDNEQLATTPTSEISAIAYASAINPTRDPEVVDLCRYAVEATPKHRLNDGTRATVIAHPLRS